MPSTTHRWFRKLPTTKQLKEEKRRLTNAQSIQKVPRKYLSIEEKEPYIQAAIHGDAIFAFKNGEHWYLQHNGQRRELEQRSEEIQGERPKEVDRHFARIDDLMSSIRGEVRAE